MNVLDREEAIGEARRRLTERIQSAADRQGPVTMGFQGGRLTEEVFSVEDVGLWASFRDAEGRYWNGFGLGNPFEDDTNVEIVVEINPPKESIDRTVGGLFAVDGEGSLHLLHRGLVGGGRPGIGKTNFLRYLDGRWPLVEVEDGDRQSLVVPITRLDADHLLAHLEAFVSHVRSFKAAVSEGEFEEPEDDDEESVEFNPEFSGKKQMPARQALEADCDHGVVVDRLVEELEAHGLVVGNDGPRDAFVPDGDADMRWLFEAKTGTDTQSIYTALGQLVFHAREGTRQVVVLPVEARDDLVGRVRERGFAVLGYEWSDEQPVFRGLEELLTEG